MRMPRFESLKVIDVRKETPDCVSILFDVPTDLKEKFAFIPGQYLTLKTDIDSEDIRRSYSICSAPYEDELRVAIKKVEGGKFSTYANELLEVGQAVEVMKPMGRFVSKSENKSGNFLFFAAGSGITPVISIIKDLLHNHPDSHVSLIYGNKGFDHIIFRETLEGLKNLFMDRFRLYHVLSREVQGEALYNGRIDQKKCGEFIDSRILSLDNYDECFICGPAEMIEAVRAELGSRSFPEDKIRFELFTTPGQNTTVKAVEKDEVIENASDVTVVIDGVEHNFKLSKDGLNVLDAANQQGADLPFACKGGVCCTCRAMLEEGEVAMDVNYSLEPAEVEQGFILTCQAHPVSDNIKVNFDIV